MLLFLSFARFLIRNTKCISGSSKGLLQDIYWINLLTVLAVSVRCLWTAYAYKWPMGVDSSSWRVTISKVSACSGKWSYQMHYNSYVYYVKHLNFFWCYLFLYGRILAHGTATGFMSLEWLLFHSMFCCLLLDHAYLQKDTSSSNLKFL